MKEPHNGLRLIILFFIGCILSVHGVSATDAKKPNILVVMGDDIGWYNTSIYNRGDMGYQTPNIDRIGKEGGLFLSWYAQQSCTAGRAAFITGQSPIRTGLTKVGLPGANLGLNSKDPSVAEVMKSLGYRTAQFGTNHLGDRNEFLPCAHGFDEFFGKLYHLNAEEEPENPDHPKDPKFRQKFGPRGVMHCWASDKDDATVDPAFGKVGMQKIENTGALTTKRMETIDDEFTDAALVWIDKQVNAGYTPFRGEKGSVFEGGFRVPAIAWWPGHVNPGSVNTDMFSHMDWWPTFASIIGQPVPTHEWKNNNGKPIIFDGIDLSASLLGTGPGKRDTMLYFAAQKFGARDLVGLAHKTLCLEQKVCFGPPR